MINLLATASAVLAVVMLAGHAAAWVRNHLMSYSVSAPGSDDWQFALDCHVCEHKHRGSDRHWTVWVKMAGEAQSYSIEPGDYQTVWNLWQAFDTSCEEAGVGPKAFKEANA